MPQDDLCLPPIFNILEPPGLPPWLRGLHREVIRLPGTTMTSSSISITTNRCTAVDKDQISTMMIS